MPDQLFYNTGIYTFIWIVTNRKAKHRRGRVQLIDATRHYVKMPKSLGSKRNELSPDQIDDITKLYSAFKHNGQCEVIVNGNEEQRVCSKVFDNCYFGFLKITVERPLRLNFQASPERISRLKQQSSFAALAESKKRKNKKEIAEETEAGLEKQEQIIQALNKLDQDKLYRNREQFNVDLDRALKRADLDLAAPVYRAIMTALAERDPKADICTDPKGNPEPDPELRDTEAVPLPKKAPLPLPIGYKGADGKEPDNDDLVKIVRAHCDDYLTREVKPHWLDAWIDYSRTKVGYEIPINRHFYVYEPPRPLEAIEADIKKLEGDILGLLKGIAA